MTRHQFLGTLAVTLLWTVSACTRDTGTPSGQAPNTTSAASQTPATGTAATSGSPAIVKSFDGSRIYWQQADDGTSLMVADSHGRHVQPLTHPEAGQHDGDPKVSPDGTRVLFVRTNPDDSSNIMVVGADGRGEHVLDLGCVKACAEVDGPTWAPDGCHIVFSPVIGPFDQVHGAARSAVLYRADVHGEHRLRLSEPGIDGKFEDYAATFAPGGYIVFVRYNNARNLTAAYRMDADGSHVHQLTPWSLGADTLSVSPARSGPSRDLVVFETYGQGAPPGKAYAIATVSAAPQPRHAAMPRIHYLTSTTNLADFAATNPAWSPDGRRVAYSRNVTGESDIWTMRWDGTDKQRGPHTSAVDYHPAWGPAPS